MWTSEENEWNRCTYCGIFNFSYAIPPVWTSARSLNSCTTDSKRTRATLCSVQLWGWECGMERQKRLKAFFGNPKNAAKFKNPSDNIVKAILGFFLYWLKYRMRKGYTQWAETCKQSNENAKSQNVSFKIISHLNQNFLTCQRKTLPEPEMLLESTWELVHLLIPFSDTRSKDGWAEITARSVNEISGSWSGTSRWKRNSILLSWEKYGSGREHAQIFFF